MELDKKDLRVLDALDGNPNITYTQLGKRAGISPQVAEYRVDKLLSQDTIYSFFTCADPGKLGYTLFRIHLSLQPLDEDALRELSGYLFERYPVFWIALVSGTFDLMIDVWATNSNQMDDLLHHLLREKGEVIREYETNPILEISLYEYGYFLEERKERARMPLFINTGDVELDATDEQILQAIKNNSRESYATIGDGVGLTRNAVKYRINNMEENGVIGGYKMMVNFSHLDRVTYKIFIHYNNSKIDQEEELFSHLRTIPSILSTTRHLGRWDLDIEIEPRNARELQNFLRNLRSTFEIIESYEFVQILEDYGLDFFPDNLEVTR